MKMKKTVVYKICLGAAAVLLLAGCGKTKEIDVQELGDALATGITYTDELSEIDASTMERIYNLTDISVSAQSVYVSSGATAEEIAVLKCASEEDAGKAEEALKERVEEQKESFADYVPAEIEKLDKAVVERKGKYAVLSISNENEKAKELISKAFQ